tara:strand:- start:195 stop:1295 length:1101 start_codon:yes stop_codon:yes gene_type:complete
MSRLSFSSPSAPAALFLVSFAFAAGCGDDSAAVMDLGPLPGDAGEIPDMTVDAFEPLLDRDGTDRLEPCFEDPSQCTSVGPWERARWSFDFACPITSVWEVDLRSTGLTTLTVVDSVGSVGDSRSPGTEHTVIFTSLDEVGTCTATVELPEDGDFNLHIVQLEPALDDLQCDELCLSDSPAGVARGCDCARTCHNACTPLGMDCGLPCNRDVPGYACPFMEADVEASDDCTYYESDTDSFEHRGRCYRCGDGNQCCYTDGHDNGTGSYDICPPLDPGPNDPDPHGCSGVFDHCDCDVTPLCGCMAQMGELDLCDECIGTENIGLSCNGPGDDATFCARAAAAATEGYDWCGQLFDVETCFDLPDGF